MEELALTWQRMARIWWLLLWRWVLGGAVLGGAVGAIIGAVLGAMGLPKMIPVFAGIAGLIVGMLWALVVVRMALKKSYIDFRIALVPRISN